MNGSEQLVRNYELHALEFEHTESIFGRKAEKNLMARRPQLGAKLVQVNVISCEAKNH